MARSGDEDGPFIDRYHHYIDRSTPTICILYLHVHHLSAARSDFICIVAAVVRRMIGTPCEGIVQLRQVRWAESWKCQVQRAGDIILVLECVKNGVWLEPAN